MIDFKTQTAGFTPEALKRIKTEQAIVRRVVIDALKAGYALSVDDGGDELAVTDSRESSVILACLMNTDDDRLILRHGDESGWVRFVYGNEPWYVIADYTVNLEGVLTGANALAERLEERESH